MASRLDHLCDAVPRLITSQSSEAPPTSSRDQGQTEFEVSDHVDDEASPTPTPLRQFVAKFPLAKLVALVVAPDQEQTRSDPSEASPSNRPWNFQHGSKVLHAPLAAKRTGLADLWRQMLHCPALPLSMMRYDLRHGSICIITSCWIAVTLFAMELEL